MIPLYRAAVDLQLLCTENRWPFCFIGGLVLQRWGEPRYTKDADITLFTDFGGEETYIDKLLAQFAPRTPDARTFALQAGATPPTRKWSSSRCRPGRSAV